MTHYKCGHETDGTIIMDSNALSFANWLNWSESVGVFGTKEKCFDCYLKDNEVNRKEKNEFNKKNRSI